VTSKIPFLLPLKANEAASLAELVFQQLEGKLLDDEQRNRLSSRSHGLGLASIRPHWGSLQADPVHGSTYYLAVDGMGQEGETALLLRMAPASSPASGIFPKAMLIGRMRPGGGREIVVNAVPFGPYDATVRTYCREVDKAFLPRPAGAAPALCICPENVEKTLPEAFRAFREIEKTMGMNLAAVEVGPAELTAAMWAAVRSGWRAGYSAGGEWLRVAEADGLEPLEQTIHQCPEFSRFSIDIRGAGTEAAIRRIVQLADFIRAEKQASKTGRAFDLEINAGGLSPGDAFTLLQSLRNEGRPAQILAVPESAADSEMADAARMAGAVISSERPGRWHTRLRGDFSADDMISLASQLRG
jgi:hypothetical protein